MTDMFEDLGKKISDVASEIGRKTENAIEIQKLKSSVRALNRSNMRDYGDIGKIIYDKYLSGEIVDGHISEICETIDKRDTEIKGIEAEIAKIQGEAW